MSITQQAHGRPGFFTAVRAGAPAGAGQGLALQAHPLTHVSDP